MSKSVITYIFLFITFLSNTAIAGIEQEETRPIILTSSSTIAVIVGMIAGNDFVVNTINLEGGCSHHYAGKLSDRNKLEQANAVIYIDDQFESFFASLVKNFTGKKYQIASDIEVINFARSGNDKKVNWHFWNNPQKTALALDGIAEFMMQLNPDKQDKILSRIIDIKKQLQQLEQDISRVLSNVGSIMLLSNSVEPLFFGLKYQKMLPGNNPSLKFVQDLEEFIKNQSDVCVISDRHDQHQGILAKYNINHIILDAESIAWSDDKNQLKQYVDYINKILTPIKACNNHSH